VGGAAVRLVFEETTAPFQAATGNSDTATTIADQNTTFLTELIVPLS
jgi:hypothetical protein